MTIDSVFEVAVKVKHLHVSTTFYKEVLGFREGLLDEKRGPVSLDWMNAVSLYFADPDGHDLELCALRSGKPSGA
jgi:catechol-2,3-dioxygenase